MKNICFIVHDIYKMGGTETVTSILSNSLCDSYNVYIISILKSQDRVPYKLDKKIKLLYLNKNAVKLRKSIFKDSPIIKEYIIRNNIDVVFMMGCCTPPQCVLSKLSTKAKFIFCDHSSIFAQTKEKDHFVRKIANLFADKIITLTKRSMQDYERLLRTPSSKIDYIYNWIDDDYIKSLENNEYNVNSKKIITVGRFSKEKGYDMLVDVAKLVFDKYPNWQWDLYGDGPEFGNIKNKIEQFALQGNLILKGQVSNINDLYKDYAMYVLTSYREGLPLVLLEAKVNRLPIVSFDCVTGPREIVEDKVNGFLIDCYDKNKMVEKICELIENEEKREDFSKNAYNNINKFSKENILNKWKNLIDTI